MLSRVADNLYWMSRYLERAEHTARLIDVQLNLMLDQSPTLADRRWARLMQSLGFPVAAGEHLEGPTLTQNLAFDTANHSSIVNCILNARENARQVREQISSEMWEQLNTLFHQVRRAGRDESLDVQPLEFLSSIKQGSHLFQGITDSTMNHGEGWQFICLGRSVERAFATATLLDVHFLEFLRAPEWASDTGDHLEWIGLLRSCTAFEAYCKVYTADLSPDRIAEFLLLDPEFPHSLQFSINRIHGALQCIHAAAGSRKSERLERLAGRLRAMLGYAQIDEIMASGLHAFLENVQRQCQHIHAAVYQVYIDYPVEVALES